MASHFSSWRGTLGFVVPTKRPGIIEEFMRYLPDGVSTLPLFINIRTGTHQELKSQMPAFEEKVAELVEIGGIDLINTGGAPPFLVQGYDNERRIVEGWNEKYKVPIYTTPMSDCAALQAYGVKRFVGITYFSDDVNRAYESYFKDAGFECRLEGIGVEFNRMHELAPTEVYRFARETLLKHPKAEAIYLLGAWRAQPILETLESDFQIPAILSIVANGWYVQKRLKIRQPIPACGRLLRELP